MKLLSLWEPWASLMACGAKRIETRSWSTSYRGWLAIHASKGGLGKKELREVVTDPAFWPHLGNKENPLDFPFGKIVAVARLESCLTTNGIDPDLLTEQERAFGDYAPGRYGWLTKSLFRLPEPIPYRAKQGLVELDEATVKLIQEQFLKGGHVVK